MRENILCRGVYLAQNTFQTASVEFVRSQRTNYARSRLQKNWRKSPEGFFDMLTGDPWGISGIVMEQDQGTVILKEQLLLEPSVALMVMVAEPV